MSPDEIERRRWVHEMCTIAAGAGAYIKPDNSKDVNEWAARFRDMYLAIERTADEMMKDR